MPLGKQSSVGINPNLLNIKQSGSFSETSPSPSISTPFFMQSSNMKSIVPCVKYTGPIVSTGDDIFVLFEVAPNILITLVGSYNVVSLLSAFFGTEIMPPLSSPHIFCCQLDKDMSAIAQLLSTHLYAVCFSLNEPST